MIDEGWVLTPNVAAVICNLELFADVDDRDIKNKFDARSGCSRICNRNLHPVLLLGVWMAGIVRLPVRLRDVHLVFALRIRVKVVGEVCGSSGVAA